jgi:hypothetical protein
MRAQRYRIRLCHPTRLLATGELAGPDQFIKDGVDPVFHGHHCAEYAEAIAGADAINAYIEAWSSAWERYVNMGY